MVLLGLLVLVGICSGLIIRFSRRFEEVLPLSILITFLVLYLCLILNLLRIALPVILLLSVASTGYFVFHITRTKDTIVLKRLFTPGTAAFGLGAVLLFLLTRNTAATAWDEFSHWMLAVRALWLSGSQGYSYLSLVNFPSYPPFAPLMEYFFLLFSGEFSESIAFFAKDIVLFSFLLPLFRNIDWKQWFKGFFLLLLQAVIILTIFPGEQSTLYTDGLMGVICAYLLLIYFTDSRKTAFTYLSISAGVCMLSMTKPSGLFIGLIPLLIIATDLFFVQRRKGTILGEANSKPQFLPIAAHLILMVGPVILWWLLSHSASLAARSVAGTDAGIFSAGIQPYHLEGLRNACSMLLADRKVGTFTLSIPSIIAISLIPGLIAIWRAKETEQYQSSCVLVGGLFAGFVLFFFGTLAMMLATFSSRLMASASSLDRYLNSYLLTMLMVFVFVLIERERAKYRFLTLLLVLCCLLPFSSLNASFSFEGDSSVALSIREPFADAEKRIASLNPATDRICLIDQGDTGEDYFILRYVSAPVQIGYCGSWSIGEPTFQYDDFNKPVSKDVWAQELLEGQYTYVYIHKLDSVFVQDFASLFESALAIQERTFYKVTTRPDGTLLLVKDMAA